VGRQGPLGIGAAETLLFLPGASGDTRFWQPVGARLRHRGERRFVAWPGFGGFPVDPAVRGIGDLVTRVVGQITGPVALLAQSMGGVIAVRVALEKPDLVRRLVLSVTSGGLDVASLGARDWRVPFRERNPQVPAWFLDEREDLTARIRKIAIPVLLLWGDADPISPVAVGQRLAEILPRAELIVIEGGTHDLVRDRAREVAPHIDRYLEG
jgi:pimeloyl-ACP methyl ester carboxylesterase